MKRIVSGAVASILLISSVGAGPGAGRPSRPSGTQPWIAPEPSPSIVLVPDYGLVPDPALVGSTRVSFDRCLIPVDGSAFDMRFAVRFPQLAPRMIVTPRVRGLPAGSRPSR